MMKEKTIKILKELVEEKLGELELQASNSKAIAREKIEEKIKLYTEIYKELKSKEKKGKWLGCCYESELPDFIGKHYA